MTTIRSGTGAKFPDHADSSREVGDRKPASPTTTAGTGDPTLQGSSHLPLHKTREGSRGAFQSGRGRQRHRIGGTGGLGIEGDEKTKPPLVKMTDGPNVKALTQKFNAAAASGSQEPFEGVPIDDDDFGQEETARERSISAVRSTAPSEAGSLPALRRGIAAPASAEILGVKLRDLETSSRQAQMDLMLLEKRLEADGEDAPDAAELDRARQHAIQTGRAFIDEAILTLSAATKHTGAPMTLNLKNGLATYAGQLLGTLGFITAASLTALKPDRATEIFFPLVGLTVPAAKELQAWATRKMGGGTFDLMIRGGHSSFPGPYKKVGAEFGMAMANLAMYVATSTALLLPEKAGEFSRNNGGGPFVRATASSLVATSLMFGAQAWLAQRTLSKNHVERSEELPILRHNRRLIGGAKVPGVKLEAATVMQSLPAWSDRTTREFKLQELGILLVSSLLAAGSAYSVAHGVGLTVAPEPGKHHPLRDYGGIAATILAGISALFVASAGLQMLAVKLRLHPAKHAHRPYGQAESEVLVRRVKQSSYRAGERYLRKLGDEIEAGKFDATAKQGFEDAVTVLSGEATRTGDHDAIKGLISQLERAADNAMVRNKVRFAGVAPGDADSASNASSSAHETAPKILGERPYDGTMKKIESWARQAVTSLEKLLVTPLDGTERMLSMNDVSLRLRGLQFLLLKCNYQAQGRTRPQVDDASVDTTGAVVLNVDAGDRRIRTVGGALMPAFAALQRCDQVESAKDFTIALGQFGDGAKSASVPLDMVATPDAHKRVMVKTVAALMAQTNQKKNFTLETFDQMVDESGRGNEPFVRAKAAMLHNAVHSNTRASDTDGDPAATEAENEVQQIFDALRDSYVPKPAPLPVIGALDAMVRKDAHSPMTEQDRRTHANRVVKGLKHGRFSTARLDRSLRERQEVIKRSGPIRATATRCDVEAARAQSAETTARREMERAQQIATLTAQRIERVNSGAELLAPADAQALRVTAAQQDQQAQTLQLHHATTATALTEAQDQKRDADRELAHLERCIREVEAFKLATGSGFLEAIAEECSKGFGGVEGPGSVRSAGAAFIGELLDDVANMHPSTRQETEMGMSIPRRLLLPLLVSRLLADVHHHPGGYSGNITSLRALIYAMDKTGTLFAVMPGIPSQVWDITDESKYYTNARHKKALDYRSQDETLALDYLTLSPDMQKRILLTITGIDLSNPATMEKTIDQRMRAFPGGIWAGVGEVTWLKEVVTAMQLHGPVKRAVVLLMKICSLRGLPVMLHCDSGHPENKIAYQDAVIAALVEAKTSIGKWRTQDHLAQMVGKKNPPQADLVFVWSHVAGESRFTPEDWNHTLRLDGWLTEHPELNWDAAWDFVCNTMMQTVDDQLAARTVGAPLRAGIQNAIKAYEAFAAMGAAADKPDDLHDKNQAASGVVTAEEPAEMYLDKLEDFGHLVKEEFNKPEVLDAFVDMATRHGEFGPNFLYLAVKHPKRGAFGSDALQIGMKAHGEAAYAINMKVLEPMFLIIDELERRRPDIAGIEGLSKKLAVDNAKAIWLNTAQMDRRKLHTQSLVEEKPADWSGRRPLQWTREDSPVTQEEIDGLPDRMIPLTRELADGKGKGKGRGDEGEQA